MQNMSMDDDADAPKLLNRNLGRIPTKTYIIVPFGYHMPDPDTIRASLEEEGVHSVIYRIKGDPSYSFVDTEGNIKQLQFAAASARDLPQRTTHPRVCATLRRRATT